MRTYEEQLEAVEQRIKSHNAKAQKTKRTALTIASVFLVIGTVATVSLAMSGNFGTAYDEPKESDATNNMVFELADEIQDTAGTVVDSGTGNRADTDFDIISKTAFYGKIVESSKSKGEIKEFFGEENNLVSVYEDERYLYFFNYDGSLNSIVNMSEFFSEIYLEADENSIKEHAENHLVRYFPDFDPALYDIEVEQHPAALPEWDITYTVKTDGIVTERIIIRFVSNGDMFYLSRSSCNIAAAISVNDAVDIALKELNKKYKVDISNPEKYDISAFIEQNGDGNIFSVTVDGIPLKNEPDFKTSYFLKINADNGQIIFTDQCR